MRKVDENRDYFASKMIPIALKSCPFVEPRDSWRGGRLPESSPLYREAVSKWKKSFFKECYALADEMLKVGND